MFYVEALISKSDIQVTQCQLSLTENFSKLPLVFSDHE